MIATDGKAERDSTFEMSTAEEKRAAEDQRIAELMGHGSDGRMSAVLTPSPPVPCCCLSWTGDWASSAGVAVLRLTAGEVVFGGVEPHIPQGPQRLGPGHHPVLRDDDRHRAVQAYYREPRNQEIFT
ncbi:ABC transporter [Cutibacterium acnes JCM 18918]|nr:ABC transporter [Cutibacterium acnes JCM 18918]